MILAGPCHFPLISPRPGRQNMTKAPLAKWPRCGRWRRKKARLKRSLLSVCTNAFLASSRYSRCCLKARPSGLSESARYCAGSAWSSHKLPGIFLLLPRTRISGVYPFDLAKEFFAWQHRRKACRNSRSVLISRSTSNFSSMCWRISPWRSVFPFCQWANAAITLRWMFWPWAYSANWSEQIGDALSTINCWHGPA